MPEDIKDPVEVTDPVQTNEEFDVGFDEADKLSLGDRPARQPKKVVEEKAVVPVTETPAKAKVDKKAKTVVEKPVEAKPVEKKTELVVEEKPKTVLEKAEEALKVLEPATESKNVLDLLPARHADMKEHVKTQAFTDWIKAQPQDVQDAAQSGDVSDAVEVSVLFKNHLKAQDSAKATTKSEVKELVKKYGDLAVVVDGNSRKLSEMATEYGSELFEALGAMAKAISDEGRVPAKQDTKTLDTLTQLQGELADMKAQAEYRDEVMVAHPDYTKITKSKEFWAAIEKAPPSIQRLVKSPSADHGILVLDWYKESQAMAAGAEGKEQASDRREKVNGLLSESVGAQKRRSETSTLTDEFDDGWEKGAAK
jgi:hypothetical protein